ncbi:hypothetical protein LCGC14_3161260, partial [marine sediment metagenome]
VLLGVAAAAAVAVLVLAYGYREPQPVSPNILRIAGGVIVGFFALDRLLRLALAAHKLAYLRENAIDFILILIAAIALVLAFVSGYSASYIVSAGALYVVITQVYLLIALVLRAASINLRFAGSGIPPAVLLVGSFLLLALVGSGLLMLPKASPEGAPLEHYPDALFTAVSATCVTGLIVKDTGTAFTPFGQGVILAMIQLGGLGIMLFGTVVAMAMGKGLSLRGSNVLRDMLSTHEIGHLRRTAVFVALATLVLEALGAALFYPMFAAGQTAEQAPDVARAVWDSCFHSISSFCNAGFSLYRQNMMTGVTDGWARPLRDHWQVLGVMAPLIVLG